MFFGPLQQRLKRAAHDAGPDSCHSANDVVDLDFTCLVAGAGEADVHDTVSVGVHHDEQHPVRHIEQPGPQPAGRAVDRYREPGRKGVLIRRAPGREILDQRRIGDMQLTDRQQEPEVCPDSDALRIQIVKPSGLLQERECLRDRPDVDLASSIVGLKHVIGLHPSVATAEWMVSMSSPMASPSDCSQRPNTFTCDRSRTEDRRAASRNAHPVNAGHSIAFDHLTSRYPPASLRAQGTCGSEHSTRRLRERMATV